MDQRGGLGARVWLALWLSALSGLGQAGEGRGQVALTFDDGPSPLFAEKGLEILDRYGVKATFFYVGLHMQAYPQIAPRVAARGHEIENHTYHHRALVRLTAEEIRADLRWTNALIRKQTGLQPRYMRPPYNRMNDTVRRVAAELGLAVVRWTIDPRDWEQGAVAAHIVAHVLHRVKEGSIVLLHERPQTLKALPELIRQLQARGYHLVTLRELLTGQAPLPTEIPEEPIQDRLPERKITIRCGRQDEAEVAEGYGYELVLGERERTSEGGFWHGDLGVEFRLTLPPGTVGTVNLLLHPATGPEGAQDVIVEGLYLGKCRGGIWVGCPVDARDTADGVLEVRLLGIGRSAGVSQVTFDADPAEMGRQPPL